MDKRPFSRFRRMSYETVKQVGGLYDLGFMIPNLSGNYNRKNPYDSVKLLYGT